MTIPLQLPQIGTTGVVPNNSAQLLQALLGGLESSQRAAELSQRRAALQLEAKRLAAADAEHEAAQRENAQLGEAVRGLLLSMTQPQAPLPPGALPPGVHESPFMDFTARLAVRCCVMGGNTDHLWYRRAATGVLL